MFKTALRLVKTYNTPCDNEDPPIVWRNRRVNNTSPGFRSQIWGTKKKKKLKTCAGVICAGPQGWAERTSRYFSWLKMQLRRKLQTQQVDVDGLNGGSQLDTGNVGHVVLLRRERSGCGAAAERSPRSGSHYWFSAPAARVCCYYSSS